MPKISLGESLDVALIYGSEKVYGQKRGGEYQDNPSKIFVSHCGNFSLGNILLLHQVPLAEKFG